MFAVLASSVFLQTLNQDIASHQSIVESVEDKGRHLVTEREASRLSKLQERYRNTCNTVKVRLASTSGTGTLL